MGKTRRGKKSIAVITRVERTCDECHTPIRPGDTQRLRKLPNGRMGWTHLDCRGRLAEQLGFNASGAIKPAPKDWNTPPSCPDCGAYMTKSPGGGHACHLTEKHADGQVIRLSAAGWRT